MDYRPVSRDKSGKFTSLTPEIDRREEYWMEIWSHAHTQIQLCQRARWEVREAIEERRVIPVDFAPRESANPPKRAA